MSKKIIGWVTGSVIFLGIGGYALARYNQNSMAHVFYQQVIHSKTGDSSKLEDKPSLKAKVKKERTVPFEKKGISKLLEDQNYTGSYAIVTNGKFLRTQYVGKDAKQDHNKYYLATDTENM